MSRVRVPALDGAREALLFAMPDRAPAILRALERRVRWSLPHPELTPHCVFCGDREEVDATEVLRRRAWVLTADSPRLMGQKVCDRCVELAHDAFAAKRIGRPEPGADMAVTEALRAMRSRGANSAIDALESALAVPVAPCAACGTRTSVAGSCALCEKTDRDRIDGAGVALCESCADLCHRVIAQR